MKTIHERRRGGTSAAVAAMASPMHRQAAIAQKALGFAIVASGFVLIVVEGIARLAGA